MNLWQDGLLALLAAWGLTALLWTLTQWMFRPRRPRIDGIWLLPQQGDADTLEEQLWSFTHWAGLPLMPRKIVLVDCGLTEQGRKTAQLLSGRDSWITLLSTDDLQEYLENEKGGFPHGKKLSDDGDHLPSGISK